MAQPAALKAYWAKRRMGAQGGMSNPQIPILGPQVPPGPGPFGDVIPAPVGGPPMAKPVLGSGARFGALKAKLAKRPGVTNPGGLAAFIGRKKYGAKKFAALGAKGRRAAAKGMHEVVTKPTHILAGERGPERVDITPLQKQLNKIDQRFEQAVGKFRTHG